VAEGRSLYDWRNIRSLVSYMHLVLKFGSSMFVRYPLLIDAVIQSNGQGFVGTDRSTMSLMARRRVESWHDGVTRTVLWGTLDADDH
jgi:hypothetical protein